MKQKNIKECFFASSSEVYSNPITIPTPENIEIKISDIYGKLYHIKNAQISNNKTRIDISYLPNGLYIILIDNELIGKFQIQR